MSPCQNHSLRTSLLPSTLDPCVSNQIASPRQPPPPAPLNRAGLDDMGSPAKYVEWAAKSGMRLKHYIDYSEQIGRHYGTLKAMLETSSIRERLHGKVSDKYVEAMIVGLDSWVKGCDAGNLAWGFFVFEKI
jgi:hypothetical protein